MYQNYVVEIKQFHNGEFEHQTYWLWDDDPIIAMHKAESKYHTVLAEACLSDTAKHSAILFTSDGFPVMNQCYEHQPEPEPEPEGEQEE